MKMFDRDETGFGLIEMTIVVVLIGIITALASTALAAFRSRAAATACRLNEKAIALAEEAYRCDRFTYLAASGARGSAAGLLDYLEGGARRLVCPDGGMPYIIAPMDDIRYSYRIFCLAAAHDWQYVTGVVQARRPR